MQLTLNNIAKIINGELKGDANTEVSGVASIEEAKKGQITFLSHKKYLKALILSNASAFIVPEELDIDKPAIKVKNPYLAFAKLLELFFPSHVEKNKNKIDQRTVIGKNNTMGKDVTIYPYVFIGDNVVVDDNVVLFPGVYIGNNCKIGYSTTIHSNVSLYDNVVIKHNVIIHSGTVIGCDGFGYTRDEKNSHYKIPQVGSVIIEENVEIGANVSIDRGTLGSTIIKKGSKIDNLVQVAHNVSIGESNLLAAQAGISGSCSIGKNVTIAGQVGLADHINIADNTILIAQSGVPRSIKKPGVYSGSPAIEHNNWKRLHAVLPKLPDFIKKLKKMEKRIEELEKNV